MNVSTHMSIGAIARHTGCTVPTIRYYEEIGLLPVAPRTSGHQRHYGPDALRRLTFIRRCRDFGFSIDQVRELVGLVDEPARPCVEVRDIAARHLGEVRKRLDELRALEGSLQRFVHGCDSACAGGPSIDCSILEDLAMPAARRPSRVCGLAAAAEGSMRTLLLFVATALAEIIGCYLPYLWLKQDRSAWLLVPAALSLALFAWLLTLHPTAAGRVYAAYGGVYIGVAIAWLWVVDRVQPTRWDWIGVAVTLCGMAIIMLQPGSASVDSRSNEQVDTKVE